MFDERISWSGELFHLAETRDLPVFVAQAAELEVGEGLVPSFHTTLRGYCGKQQEDREGANG